MEKIVNFIICGASGDLTKRKIIPAIHNLYKDGHLPTDFFIIGLARTKMSNDEFIKHIDPDNQYDKDFKSKVQYIQGDYDTDRTYKVLGEKLEINGGNRLIYLAVPPEILKTISSKLSENNIVNDCACLDEKKSSYCVKKDNWSRVIFEKPFGTDFNSAKDLDDFLQSIFRENQIYRIDHYLGKETVQNIMAFRFANSIFEPLWNNHYVDHIEINVSEEVKIESRGSYFDKAGIVRDIIQNHALQLLALLLMEPPISFEANAVRDEKVKLLKSLTTYDIDGAKKNTLRASYKGYTDEAGVEKNSKTETFAAIRLSINNWRWAGVPVYIRAGKALGSKTTEAHIYFKGLPHKLFNDVAEDRNLPNKIVFKFQPKEGIQLSCLSKIPGSAYKLTPVDMDFNYNMNFAGRLFDAYERLLLDAMNNDLSLFIRNDEIEEAWKFVDSFLKVWENDKDFPLYSYQSGQNGPEEMHDFIKEFGHLWNKEYCRLKV